MSTGTKSVFLSPTDALHGDIGIVAQDDLLVLVSKSGSTEELLKLIPYAKVLIYGFTHSHLAALNEEDEVFGCASRLAY